MFSMVDCYNDLGQLAHDVSIWDIVCRGLDNSSTNLQITLDL